MELIKEILDKLKETNPFFEKIDFEYYKNHELITKLNLTESEFNKNASRIKEYVDEHDNCIKIPNKCINDNEFHILLYRDKKTNEIKEKAEICPKLKHIVNSKNNYIYRTFDDKQLKILINKDYFGTKSSSSKCNLVTKLLTYEKPEVSIKGVYIFGKNGVGKTYSLTAFCNGMTRNNNTVAFCFIPKLAEDVCNTYKDSSGSNTGELSDKLKTADILVLDDFGANSEQGYFYNKFLLNILDHRNDANLPTFYTSNYSLVDLEKHLKRNIKNEIDVRRIIERVKISDEFKLEDKNYRDQNNTL
ncbi:primosomal protein DnaI [Bacilli bacterium]|nr:primosomal protein DnaI [Bacilli bacterium]